MLKATAKQAHQRLKCAYGELLLLGAATNSLDAELNPRHLTLLSARQLRILRNAVYARHGRPFDSKDLKDYFSIRSWYRADRYELFMSLDTSGPVSEPVRGVAG